jgi:hypothetical protein
MGFQRGGEPPRASWLRVLFSTWDSKGACSFGRVRGEALYNRGLIKQGLPCAIFADRRMIRIESPHQGLSQSDFCGSFLLDLKNIESNNYRCSI